LSRFIGPASFGARLSTSIQENVKSICIFSFSVLQNAMISKIPNQSVFSNSVFQNGSHSLISKINTAQFSKYGSKYEKRTQNTE